MAEEKLKEQIVSEIGIKNIMPILEQMGFTFTKSNRFPNLVGVSLPDDYTADVVSDTKKLAHNNKPGVKNFNRELFREERIVIIDFYDELGNKRGSFFINKTNSKASTIYLTKRLNIHHQKHGVMNEIYFGTEQTKLISFGSVNTEVGSSLYIANKASELTEKVKKAASEFYPDWKNPSAYWELTDEELVAMLPRESKAEKSRARINPSFLGVK